MKLVDLDIKSFIEKLESSSPTPGGGSASALAVALGISLVLMVVNITAAKKKFKTLADDDRTEFLAAAGRLDALKEEALALVDEDAAVYAEVLAAYRLPRESAAEKAAREESVAAATLKAADAPFKTAKVALSALRETQKIYPHAHKNAISDLGVGVKLIGAGCSGAVMNVKINMKDFPDSRLAGEYLRAAEKLEEEARQAGEVILAFVSRNL